MCMAGTASVAFEGGATTAASSPATTPTAGLDAFEGGPEARRLLELYGIRATCTES